MKSDFFNKVVRSAARYWWIVLILSVIAVGGSLGFSAFGKPRTETAQLQPAEGVMQIKSPDWLNVDTLIGEQKLAEAAKAVDGILATARKAHHEEDWTRALVMGTQLRLALHGYETAVRFLKDEQWPAGQVSRMTLDLFYANALTRYLQQYSWEIRQREKVESKGGIDLKAWTSAQISQEALRAYLDVWAKRESLGIKPVSYLAEYITPNTYPVEVRGMLRDAVSYLLADFLADTSFWTTEQSNSVYRLDRDALMAEIDPAMGDAQLADANVHPLSKVVAVLADLESWHKAFERRAAQLETRRERLRRLWAAFDQDDDRLAVRRMLEQFLPGFRDESWWAMGIAELATMVENEPGSESKKRAHDIALKGYEAYPTSLGGARCLAMVKTIEAPEYRLTSMRQDGARKRSISVDARNIKGLFFRAFRYDLIKRLTRTTAERLQLSQEELVKLVRSGRHVAAWQVDLPVTGDYRLHRTYVTPPIDATGAYAIIASTRADFAPSDNQLLAADLVISDLVLISSQRQNGSHEVRALSGATGEPIADVAISLYRRNWRQPPALISSLASNRDGIAVFPLRDNPEGGNFLLLGQLGEQFVASGDWYNYYRTGSEAESRLAFIYTDRSIYRPQQKVLWKVVAFAGKGREGRFATLPQTSLEMYLIDPNGERVATVQAKTNVYGTASGEFVVPAGRVLGSWRVDCSLHGSQGIKVEEYKRPTFEASIKDPKEPLRLNRPASLYGEARYYFGLPLTSGKVSWKVTRETVYNPWFWAYSRRGRGSSPQIIASGVASVEPDGSFKVDFTPEVDERAAKADPKVVFHYHLSADVTDEGGETRTTERSFRLGFCAVEASIKFENKFFVANDAVRVDIQRASLDGLPRLGKGSWRLARISQPEIASLPADIPTDSGDVGNDDGDAIDPLTPGDRQRPRWNPSYNPEAVMRGWADGELLRRGETSHDLKGTATLDLGKLTPGAYRLRYETKDEFGAKAEATSEFVVVGAHSPLALPVVAWLETSSVKVGEKVRLFVHSGLNDQPIFVDFYRDGEVFDRRRLTSGRDASLLDLPITAKDRGGFGITVSMVRDHQFMTYALPLYVPWDDRQLDVSFATFRDTMRPGGKETWRVTVKGPNGKSAETGAVELLAYMYDKSLDFFAPHNPPEPMSQYPWRSQTVSFGSTLGEQEGEWVEGTFIGVPGSPFMAVDRLLFFDSYGIGGPGMKGYSIPPPAPAMRMAAMPERVAKVRTSGENEQPAESIQTVTTSDSDIASGAGKMGRGGEGGEPPSAPQTPPQLRSDFSETAFWQPHLITGKDGSASIEFTVPDSVTSWNVWVHAITRDLRSGSLHKEARSVKELMIRPYVPRFLREGDQAEIKVVINNASDKEIKGVLSLDIFDPEDNTDRLAEFGLTPQAAHGKAFSVAAGGGSNLTFPLTVPSKVGTAAFKVVATAGDLSDGELRPVPVLPGRMHLTQSRFVTLKNADRRELSFEDLKRNDDSTRINEQMVVTVDAQLFYTVLQALPYLVNYPYECSEQTLNRFLSTGIVSSLYDKYPAVSRMAKEFAKRETMLETFAAADPNRKMLLEETPWLTEAKGGTTPDRGLINVLDPRVAKAQRDEALAKLVKTQTASGAFPWWPGGPPSPYMTIYIMHGLAKAAEFGVDVPKGVVQKGWNYLAGYYRNEVKRLMADDCCFEYLTFLNYVATCYPDPSWMGDALKPEERKEILAFCFKHWKEHSPYLKGYLALTLKRSSRDADANLVWQSVMDSAKTNDDEGTHWSAEDRSWLWYNDTIETHAFALRTLLELSPNDTRKDGLVQWILLNKKLNQWKSTRATAEVIYSLVHYLKREGALGIPEDATVTVGNQKVSFTFDPEVYTGKRNQVVIPGEKMSEKTATVIVEKKSKGFAFASATWSFSTEKLPETGQGDFFSVSRVYFKRESTPQGNVLKPLAEGAAIAVGDQIEVQLSLRAKHSAEYVHLRDPRAAGLEPESAVSRFKWDLGLGYYEEIRDSGSNFFFEQLPQGEYTFKYRLRANMAGTFKISPATVQSMYAPEFFAYSAGSVITIIPADSH